MNCGSDHYRELLNFLQETENEISKVFENDISQENHFEHRKPSPPKADVEDVDIDFLVKLNETIESDISELLAKNDINEDSLDNFKLYCDFKNDDLIFSKNAGNRRVYNIPVETKITCDASESNRVRYSIIENHKNIINAATQTSPSLSPSSTNLTWASECSSSPCLTSTSDSDLIDEDTLSTSSTDARDLASWSAKQILGSKSSSTPILKRGPTKVNKQSRSQSDRHLAEIEAAEACKWLRATGFPQYAQLYEDQQFPIDIATAAQDHPLLESDVLNSLYRRLQILNSCAHLHQQRVIQHTDESEDEYCALSDNWTYQSDIRRWSRNCNKVGCSNAEESTKRLEAVLKKDGEVFEKSNESPRERLRRAGSTKFRRRREGILFSEKDNVLDVLSQQLSDLKSCEINHVSDSELTPKHTRQSRTKSFEKSDSWSLPQNTTDRVIWQRLPEKEATIPEQDIVLDNSGPLISHLSATQLQVLKKLALLKLTAHIEKYCPTHRTGWNWDLPKFIRKMKGPVYKDKNVFGVPLTVIFQRTGQVLPRNIEEAMRWLQQNATDQLGIFRKPGVKSRIQSLRNIVESTVIVNYTEYQCYDVADMVKQYFRELPEILLTTKFSETFVLIFQYVPVYLRRESVLCALLLMPDEHLEVLHILLAFLQSFAQKSHLNQMDESNLAMCFAPSLFHYSQTCKQSTGTPHPKELAENKAGHECLLYFLKNFNNLFRIPQEIINQCKSSEIKETKAKLLTDLGSEIGGWREYLKECQTNLLKEAREKSRGWIPVTSHHSKVDISYKKVADGLPLKLWKVSTDIEAPPAEVMHRILRERHIWDFDLHSAKIVSLLEKKTEVFQYIRKGIHPIPNQEFCVLRTWRSDLPKDACIIVETSVELPDVILVPNTIRGIVLASRYLIEPCGSGKSRLMHLSRVDTMGKTSEWYQKNYGHLCAIFIANIQNSFYQNALGPESKV